MHYMYRTTHLKIGSEPSSGSVLTSAITSQGHVTSYNAVIGQAQSILPHTHYVICPTQLVMPSGRHSMAEVLSQVFGAGLEVQLFILFKEAVIAYQVRALIGRQRPRLGADFEVGGPVHIEHHHHEVCGCVSGCICGCICGFG